MKKIIKPFLLLCAYILFVCATSFYFQSYTIGTNSTLIYNNPTVLNRINAINTNSVTAFLKFYDFRGYSYTTAVTTGTVVSVGTFTAVPSYTTNPKMIIQVNANSEDWNNVMNTYTFGKTVCTFTAGVWVRATATLPANSTVSVGDIYLEVEH